MLKNINQSMVNRSIAGGGVNCKCIGGGSNSNGVNGGKITVEFAYYVVTVGDEVKYYITEEDAHKIYDCLYNVYPTKYILTDFELQFIMGDKIGINRGYVIQSIQSTIELGKSIINATINLTNGSTLFASFFIHVIDGKLNTEQSVCSFGHDSTELVDSKDVPILEGVDAMKHSLTIYYMER